MARYIDAELLIEAMQGRKFANDECLRHGTDSSDKEYYRHLQFEDGIMMGFVREEPTADVIPIPDGATNGDMVLATGMFSVVKELNDGIMVYVKPKGVFGQVLEYKKDWWNAPYKGTGN